MHEIQLGILNKLLFAKELRYSDLKVDPSIENNTFQFHLNKVIHAGYVLKNRNNLYELTLEGKKFATHIDTDKNQLVQRRKLSVRLFCDRMANNQREVLVYTRLKHPFYGKQGFPAGKVQVGETFTDAAVRELFEETGLKGKARLFNITHYLVKDATSSMLLDDKLFLDFHIPNPTGQLTGNNEGKFEWIALDSLPKWLENPFDSAEAYLQAFEIIDRRLDTVVFNEMEHLTDDF